MTTSFDPESLRSQAETAAETASAMARKLEKAEALVAAKRLEADQAREKRLSALSPAERRTVETIESRRSDRSLSEFRREIVENSRKDRQAIADQLGEYVRRMEAASEVFASPGALLNYRGGLNERRAHLATTLEHEGHASLLHLRARALAEQDLTLAAALHSRVSRMPRAERPFSPSDLTALVEPEYREVRQTIDDIKQIAEQALASNARFETGRKPNSIERLESGLAARKRDGNNGLGTAVRRLAR